MAAISAAVIAASATLTAAFVTQFLSERYKRFKDGSSLAAGIAGELNSYREAFPILQRSLHGMVAAIDSGNRRGLAFRTFEKPMDRYFDEVVGRLGILGPELVEQIIYIYNNLNAFRAAFALINDKHADMQDDELRLRIELTLAAAERAATAMTSAVPKLLTRSTARFKLVSLE